MSRIGNKPLLLPDGVKIEQINNMITVTGKNGSSTINIPRELEVSISNNVLTVINKSSSKKSREMHGTIRRLIENAAKGAIENFSKKLELVGLGYRGQISGNQLTLQVGFTHPVILEIPTGISVSIDKNIITVEGASKHLVGQFCAKIRQIRKPEPYKGKGIRYFGEVIKLKQGKATKGA